MMINKGRIERGRGLSREFMYECMILAGFVISLVLLAIIIKWSAFLI